MWCRVCMSQLQCWSHHSAPLTARGTDCWWWCQRQCNRTFFSKTDFIVQPLLLLWGFWLLQHQLRFCKIIRNMYIIRLLGTCQRYNRQPRLAVSQEGNGVRSCIASVSDNGMYWSYDLSTTQINGAFTTKHRETISKNIAWDDSRCGSKCLSQFWSGFSDIILRKWMHNQRFTLSEVKNNRNSKDTTDIAIVLCRAIFALNTAEHVRICLS